VVKYSKSGTDRLTDFKLGENYPNVEINMFNVIRSHGPEVEICQIFNLYSEKHAPESVVLSPNYCSLL